MVRPMVRRYSFVVEQLLDPSVNNTIATYLYLRAYQKKAPELSHDEYEAQCDAYRDCWLWMSGIILSREKDRSRAKVERLVRLAPQAKKAVYQEFLDLLKEGNWL